MSITKEKLERLKKLYEVANDGLSKAEFLESFKKVFNQVLQIETKVLEKVNKAISDLKGQNNASLDALKADFQRVSSDLGDMVAKALKEQENGLNFIRDKVRKIKEGKDGYIPKKGVDYFNGQDGKDADEEKVINEVLKKINIPEIDESRLEALEKEMRDEIDNLKRRGRLGGGGFSKIASDGHILDPYIPIGTVNGTNTDFTLQKAPNPTGSLKVYINGMLMSLTEDYTVSKVTVTMNTAPPTGSIIKVEHRI